MPVDIKDVESFIQHRSLELEDTTTTMRAMPVGALAVMDYHYKRGHLLYKYKYGVVSLDDETIWDDDDREHTVRLVKRGSAVTLVTKQV